MSRQAEKEAQFKRTAVYLAPAAYGKPVEMNQMLVSCRKYIEGHKDLRLMRIYRDEKVEIIREGKKSPLAASGNDAWNRLLTDTETSAVEVVVIGAARTVAPSISNLENMVKNYFIPCGIRFVDVETGFDTAYSEAAVEDYFKARVSEYRSTVRRGPYRKREKNGDVEMQVDEKSTRRMENQLRKQMQERS